MILLNSFLYGIQVELVKKIVIYQKGYFMKIKIYCFYDVIKMKKVRMLFDLDN